MRAIKRFAPWRVASSAGFLALLLSISCTDVSGPDKVSSLAILEYLEHPPRIEVPPTAIIGEPIEVAIETYGELSCILLGETMVERVDDLRFEITPFDIFVTPGPGGACTSRLVTRRHVVSISFDRPGVGRIIVRGRAYSGGQPSQNGELVEFERALTVTID